MKPHKIEIYIYADSEEQVKELQQAAYDFVADNYKRGIIVTASRVSEALKKFKDNFFVTNFLKK